MPVNGLLGAAAGPDDDFDPADGYYHAPYAPLPNVSPPNTYTGAIPTPPSDYAATRAVLPHDYYQSQQLMNQAGPPNPLLDQVLQLLALRRKNRT
jgi:hypothetical protein